MNMDALNLLDATLEDLADLKKFEPLPVGSYLATLKWTYPEDDTVVIVCPEFTVVEALEIPGVEPENFPEAGRKAMFYLRLQNKDGSALTWEDGTVNDQDQGRLKEILTALAPVFNPDGTLTVRQMIEASEGAEVLVSFKVRASKKDPDSQFNTIKAIALPE